MSKAGAHLLLLVFASLTLCACKQRQHLTKSNIQVLERQFARAQAQSAGRDGGLSVKEVESVLGPPHRVDPPETALRDVELFRYYYQQDAETYELHFLNSRLFEIKHLAAAPASLDPKP